MSVTRGGGGGPGPGKGGGGGGGGGGGVDSAYERGGYALRKFRIKPLKETDLRLISTKFYNIK